MPPSILQLTSIGVQDVYLTKDPQINVFKYTYYRYVNFATEVVEIPLNEPATFNRRSTCDILKRGHLLSKLYLHIKLPPLIKNMGTYLGWTDAIGYAIFSDPIELEIGGVVIDRLYPQFLEMWDELSNINKRMGRDMMVGKNDIYVSGFYNAQQPLELVIPLDFWFCKQYSSALPLLSMYNQPIRINFRFRDFPELINFDGSDPAYSFIVDGSVFAEYIYLDDVILDQFQKQKHMYIIEQTQYTGDETIPQNISIFNCSLKFNHPVKELVFACVETNNVDNNNYFCYSNSIDNTSIIERASLLLDGTKRFDNLPEIYYRTIFPDSVHSTIPLKYIYTMPFSIQPEQNQPTGSLNMSRFTDVTLQLQMMNNNKESYLYVFAVNYNIVTIENGTFSLEWAV